MIWLVFGLCFAPASAVAAWLVADNIREIRRAEGS